MSATVSIIVTTEIVRVDVVPNEETPIMAYFDGMDFIHMSVDKARELVDKLQQAVIEHGLKNGLKLARLDNISDTCGEVTAGKIYEYEDNPDDDELIVIVDDKGEKGCYYKARFEVLS